MEIRASLNKKPGVYIGIAAALIVGSAFAVFRESRPQQAAVDTRVYFSDDDGKTWFKDEVSNFPPYDHSGKQAVRCYLYQHNGQTFVGYLEKYTDNVKTKILNRQSVSDSDMMVGTLVKHPGDATWIPIGDPRGRQILNNVRAPDGSTDVTSLDD